jgi:hypothetical protein
MGKNRKKEQGVAQHLGNWFFSLCPSPPSPSSLLEKADLTGIKRKSGLAV